MSGGCRVSFILLISIVAWRASADSPGELGIWPARLQLRASESHRILVHRAQGDGFEIDLTAKAAFTTDHPEIAIVESNGVVRAKTAGTAHISAAIDGAKSVCEIQVTAPRSQAVSFIGDVMPVLSRAGCNAGACHAKPQGQSGFKFSIFAYDLKSDYRPIVKDARGRRVFPAAPEESLLLRKPTLAVEHGGGKRLDVDSDAYRLLLRWIEQGMPYAREGEPSLASIEVYPKERRYHQAATQPLLLRASYSDGSARDVTQLADFTSTDKELVKVSEMGRMRIGDGQGEAAGVVRFLGLVAVSRVTVPSPKLLPPSDYAALPENNFIDHLVYERHTKLGILPSQTCSDAEFLRRTSLDAIGALPTAEEAEDFLRSRDPDKRVKAIDRLLAEPRYG